jgi:hypothetical protein
MKVLKIASHIVHEYTMNFWVKDKISCVPFNGGKRYEWPCVIKTKGAVSPRSVQRYMQRARILVDSTLCGANVMVHDELLKHMESYVVPSLVKYKHGRQLIVTSPEDQLLLQQTGMMSRRKLLMFNRLLLSLTVISIHSTSMMLIA